MHSREVLPPSPRTGSRRIQQVHAAEYCAALERAGFDSSGLRKQEAWEIKACDNEHSQLATPRAGSLSKSMRKHRLWPHAELHPREVET